MNKDQRKESALETLRLYEKEKLSLPTKSTFIESLPPISNRKPKSTKILVEDSDVVVSVFNEAIKSKVGVMNFASPVNPGGGYENGAQAQEESICRASFLGPELCKFKKEYYEPNRRIKNGGLSSSSFIYSKDVKFIKKPVNGQELLVNPVFADVVTIAAPSQRLNDGTVTSKDYSTNIAIKIQQTLRAFKTNNCDTLILGAFGCGVFGNNPTIVAELFKHIIETNEFKDQFKTIIFSIYGKNENYIEFSKVFSNK